MATRTSVGSGNWGTAGTWDTGIPADGDDVVIASGHTVTFNVDQSTFTTGIGLTITGTLTHTTTTGTYVLKAKTGASIVGAGTWNIGTSGTPIPFAAKHTITGAAGWYVDGNSGLTMTVFGAEPTYTYVKLSGNEAIGQTELSVDTDVTGDIWAAGDTVRINDINQGLESEERVIAAGGIAAGTITVTAGLTAAKSTGAYICLITRNIKIVAVGTGTRTIYRVGSTSNKLTIGGGAWLGVNKYMLDTCNYSTISGGTFSGNNYALNICSYATISGGTFSGNSYLTMYVPIAISGGLFTGQNIVLSTTTGAIITGGIFSGNNNVSVSTVTTIITGGTFSGNTYVFQSATSPIVSGGTFSGNTDVIYNCISAEIFGGTFTSNTRDMKQTSGKLYGVTLGSTDEHNSYTSMTPIYQNCQSENHNGVDGALKAWCKGGVVTSQTSVKPTGYTQAYLLDPESATYPVFFTKQFSVEPGKSVSVEAQLRKDSSMTYLPRVYLMASIGNPLAGATPIDTFTMTDSVDTWETDTFSISNTTDYDQDYTLWFVAQNATGNVYSAYDITTEGGSGGAVRILPFGGIGL